MIPPTLPPLPGAVEAGKLFEWAVDGLIRRCCPVCGVDDAKIICVRPDKLSVAKCRLCGLIYLPDIPDNESISRFYNMYTENKGYDESSANVKPLNLLKRILLARAHFGIQILNSFDGLDGKKLCEIGCSFGTYMQLARFCGADVIGVEIDTKARASVKHHLGIPVVNDIVDVMEPQDIICAFSVFEHLPDPRKTLREMYQCCAQDGRLLLSMPNGGNFESAGFTWAGFRVDLEHINYFSIKTLSEILAECGFFVEQYWHLNQLHTNRYAIRPSFNKIVNKLVFNSSKFICEGNATLVVLARKV